MAEAVSGQPLPTTTGELLGTMVEHLPTSALFAIDKVTASLHWSAGTPYALPGEQALRPLGWLVLVAAAPASSHWWRCSVAGGPHGAAGAGRGGPRRGRDTGRVGP